MGRRTEPSRRSESRAMTPQSSENGDPFDLDFEADDDFKVHTPEAADPWRDPETGAPSTGVPLDPFAGLGAPDHADATATADKQPGAAAPAPAANPIADMLASAEAA